MSVTLPNSSLLIICCIELVCRCFHCLRSLGCVAKAEHESLVAEAHQRETFCIFYLKPNALSIQTRMKSPLFTNCRDHGSECVRMEQIRILKCADSDKWNNKGIACILVLP